MNIYVASEIPYDQLKDIGISKRDFLKLPAFILDKVMTGRLSPLLLLKMDIEEKTMLFYAKIAFVRTRNGLELKIFPQEKELKTDFELSTKEKAILENGGVINKRISNDGENRKSYVQLDPETNNVISVETKDIHIPYNIDNIILDDTNKKVISSGKLLELNADSCLYTIGIDLQSDTGIRIVQGDAEKWRNEKLIEWDRNNHNATGYWLTSENGWQFAEFQNSSLILKR